MTAQEYLSQATNIDLRIDALKEAADKERERATSTGVKISAIPPQFNGSTSDKVGESATNAAYNEMLATDLERKARELRNTILLDINKLHNNVYAALLTDKYINNFSWESIAERLEKTPEYVRGELHARALKYFDKYHTIPYKTFL